jgi:hypothetical protein
MRTEGRAATALSIVLSAAALMWPSLWNGYPLVFADTGTYLSQAIEHYIGWDRPVFYSLFLLPLHMTITIWPAIVAQALLVAYTLHLVRRTLLPAFSAWWLVPIAVFLSVATALPWFASQLVPDVFTSLLVLVLSFFQLPTISAPMMAPNLMSVRRDSPRHMTVLPGGGSLARAR